MRRHSSDGQALGHAYSLAMADAGPTAGAACMRHPAWSHQPALRAHPAARTAGSLLHLGLARGQAAVLHIDLLKVCREQCRTSIRVLMRCSIHVCLTRAQPCAGPRRSNRHASGLQAGSQAVFQGCVLLRCGGRRYVSPSSCAGQGALPRKTHVCF